MPEGFYDQFKSPSSLSPNSKINLSVNGSISGGANPVKDSIASKLSLGGLSATSLSSVSGSLDNLVGKLRSEVSGFAQKGIERISPNKLVNSRASLAGDASTHAASHAPETKIKGSRSTNSQKNSLQYPLDMRKYYISFGFGEYSRPSPYLESTWKPDFYIFLPMPASLVDATAVQLNTESNPGIVGQVVEQVAGAITAMGPNAKLGEQSVVNTGAGAAYTAAVGAIPDTFGGAQVTGTVGQLVGGIPNPHLNVFFQGVNLRSHSFVYKFAPKNAKESATIASIIKYFKASALPNYRFGAANVLGYPKIVQISLEPKLKNQTMFYKKCMISSVNVNYAAQGTPSFFAGTSYPTHIEMQLNLQEIEIVSSRDYGGKDGNLSGDISKFVGDIKSKISDSVSSAGKTQK